MESCTTRMRSCSITKTRNQGLASRPVSCVRRLDAIALHAGTASDLPMIPCQAQAHRPRADDSVTLISGPEESGRCSKGGPTTIREVVAVQRNLVGPVVEARRGTHNRDRGQFYETIGRNAGQIGEISLRGTSVRPIRPESQAAGVADGLSVLQG